MHDDRVAIERFVQNGKFVVVLAVPLFCPRTGDYLGEQRYILGVFATRLEAEGYLAENPEPKDTEVCSYILPYASQPPSPHESQDGIPF